VALLHFADLIILQLTLFNTRRRARSEEHENQGMEEKEKGGVERGQRSGLLKGKGIVNQRE